jgi:hypothetical protein
MRPGRRPSPWLVLACLACACEEVPTLTFDQRDAGPDVEDGAASGPDAGTDGGCGGLAPPQAAYVCCGAVVCQGLCNATQCDACTSKCTSPGQICCAKNNNVVCLPAGSICH